MKGQLRCRLPGSSDFRLLPLLLLAVVLVRPVSLTLVLLPGRSFFEEDEEEEAAALACMGNP